MDEHRQDDLLEPIYNSSAAWKTSGSDGRWRRVTREGQRSVLASRHDDDETILAKGFN